jgi:AcrR family transcriptional regulator
VEQAIEMNIHGGLGAMTMRRLSNRIGVTEPALYRHFENKTAILVAMLNVLEDETYERLPFGEHETAETLVEHFVRLFQLFEGRPALSTVVFLDEFVDADPQLQARVRQLLSKNHRRLTEALATLEVSGSSAAVPDPDSLATLLLGGVRLVVRRWRLDGCRWSLVERGKRVVSTLTALVSGDALGNRDAVEHGTARPDEPCTGGTA